MSNIDEAFRQLTRSSLLAAIRYRNEVTNAAPREMGR